MSVGVAMLMTAGYALLAGWGLPVQRALIMVGTVLFCLLLARQVQPWTQFVAALVLVSLFDPMASLSQGFWMSFGAVAALLFGLSDRAVVATGPRQKLTATLQAQWVVYLGMMPVLAALLSQLPVGALLVNVIAIPWVGLMLVPLVFCGVILQLVVELPAQLLLNIAAWQISELWQFLNLVNSVMASLPLPAIETSRLMLVLFGTVCLLLPAGLVSRWPALLVVLLLLRQPGIREDRPELRLTFLDVGQGLSVVIETRDAVHIYDTGPMVPDRFSAADQFLLPTLRARGWQQVSVLLLSHFDNDHAGGRDHIMRVLPVHRRLEPGQCEHRWTSAGVRFHAFQALPGDTARNDGSCLLLVQAGKRVILLTGDIETRGEHALLERALPQPDVMSSPHHGSDSSSSPALLNQLRPDTMIISAGYNNRFGHPSQKIMTRYRQRAIRTLNTAEEGGIVLTAVDGHIRYQMARRALPAIWRRQAVR
jgi:competence protein ComEC